MAFGRPPLRWLGGKYGQLNRIARYIPEDTRRTIEPFAGSAAFSLNLGRGSAIVNDINTYLIRTYRHMRWRPHKLRIDIETLSMLDRPSKEEFATVLCECNTASSKWDASMRFIWIDKHCYGGRVAIRNGKVMASALYSHSNLNEERFAPFAKRCRNFVFTSEDYSKSLGVAGKGDFVYIDPPYSSSEHGASFADYSDDGFNTKDHHSLVKRILIARDRGATIVVSNHYTPETQALYADANKIESFDVNRRGACQSNKSRSVKECLAIYYPNNK